MVGQGVIKLLLVDDHNILVDVMTRQFEQDRAFEVAAWADSIDSALLAIKEHQPDVVLLDIDLGRDSGLDAIGDIRDLKEDIKIVIITMFEQTVYRDRAFQLGADAYVTKSVGFVALRELLIGKESSSNSNKSAGKIWKCPKGRRTGAIMGLSERELQVVRGLSAGKREKEVADSLDISVSSVSTYLKRAMLKTEFDSRAELFRYASALGVEAQK